MSDSAPQLIFDQQAHTISDGVLVHKLFPHALWYLAPDRTSYEREDGPVNPYDFGILKHNAKSRQGLYKSIAYLHRDHPLQTRKSGLPHQAEKGLRRLDKSIIRTNLPGSVAYFCLGCSHMRKSELFVGAGRGSR